MRDWLEEDHLVYRLLDVVESLDIRSISRSIHAKDARGVRPYNPRMMLVLLLYSYMNGIYSSRQIAAATYERIDFRVLTGDQHPFHTVINEFRLRHLDALPPLFVQVLQLCDRAGLLKLEHVSLDGSKVNANASKHKAMSHGRMVSEIRRLEKEIQELLAKAKVEPVFGHIKEPRGFRRFSLRGVFKVRAEWTLVCLCHNLIELLAPRPDLAGA